MPRAGKVDRRRGPQHRMEPMVVAKEAAQYGISAPSEVSPGEKFISPNQAARILNVTGEAVKQWIYHRRLIATKLTNGYWKIKVSDLEGFIKARQDLGQKKIMIIDAPGPRSSEIASAIEKLGHTVVLAQTPIDALLKAADLYPSLFVANVSLKEFDVWKLMQRISNTRNIRNAPLLIIAEHELKESESELALELGAQAFLNRPFKPQTLVDELEKILKRIL
jgi:CheY-like chemotaxis protein